MSKLTDAQVSKLIRDGAYLCTACADQYGADFPKGHEPTISMSECGFCGAYKPTCHTSDWNWPRVDMKTQRKSSARREF